MNNMIELSEKAETLAHNTEALAFWVSSANVPAQAMDLLDAAAALLRRVEELGREA